MVCDGVPDGESTVSFLWRGEITEIFAAAAMGFVAAFLFVAPIVADEVPAKEAFQVLHITAPVGPSSTPFLQYQAEQAWELDEARQKRWENIRTPQELTKLQDEYRKNLLQMIGGLPEKKTDLHPRITGKIQMDGFTIEKLIFESLPGVYVTALVYSPNDHSVKHPAVLVPAGHATDGKLHYQALSQRLVGRGYVVISWDPIGQGERSQFWDAKAGKSRYNLICAEHAVMGNLAYLAGTNLIRWEIWDGIRAADYLLTRSDVDADRVNITGTSGGGTQATLIAAVDPRIKVIAPSCYISSLPMRMYNRIFVDPDSDPEQDLYGIVSSGMDHPGLLLLMYPRPVIVASAVLDFFPIEGARKTYREARDMYLRFGHGDRIAMTEGYHTHQYSAENQEAALNFLDHFNGMPAREGLPPVKELDSATLLCTSTGQVMVDFPDAKPLLDYIREYYEERKGSTSTTLAKEYFNDKHLKVDTWSVREYGQVAPTKNEILWKLAGSSKAGDVTIDRYVLRHSHLLEMPLLYIHKGTGQREVLLWFKESGKAAEGDWAELRKYLDSGYDIISVDFRGLGETRMQYTAASPDDPSLTKNDFDRAYLDPLSGVLANQVYNSLLLGHPYLLQMIEDAEIARHFAEGKLGVKIMAVTSPDEGFTTASSIVKVLPGLKLLPQPGMQVLNWSDIVEKKRELWPVEYLLPSGAYIH